MTLLVTNPLTEAAYATRQFYTSSDVVSPDGLFSVSAAFLQRIKQVDFVDAGGSALSIAYKDKPA